MYNQPVNGSSAVLDLTQAADVHVVVVLKNDAGINDGLNVTELIIPKSQPGIIMQLYMYMALIFVRLY